MYLCAALYAFILAQGLYLFLPREPVLCATGSRLPAIYDWSISIFRARISPTVPRGSCVLMSNVRDIAWRDGTDCQNHWCTLSGSRKRRQRNYKSYGLKT